MIVQLNPTIPLTTPLGKALCHFLIDNGDEHHLLWVCIQDDTGEIWVWPNTKVRGRNNPTMGRKINDARNDKSLHGAVNTACRFWNRGMGSGYICEDAMTDDLVKQLRKNVMCGDAVIEEAADRIEKLEAALREITWIATPDNDEARHKATEIARKALDAK